MRLRLTLSWQRSLSYRTSPLICRANQWTGFYMISASVMTISLLQQKLCLLEEGQEYDLREAG